MARLAKVFSIVLFSLVALCSFAQTAPQSRIVRSINNAELTPLHGSAFPLARAEFDHGRVDRSMQLHNVSIIFKRSAAQQHDMDTLLAEQQNRTSPNYHKWLTPQQMADRFGMTADDIAKVSAWLTSQGLTIDITPGTRTRIVFSGTAAQIEAAFHTEIHQYQVNGESHFSNAGEISLPQALTNVVLGFRGLNDFQPKPRHSVLQKISASPRLNAGGGQHLLAPEDFATIYDLKRLYDQGIDGTGQTIAVAGQTAIKMSDITSFRSASGLSVNNPTIVTVPGTGTPTIRSSGDLGEADLDIEWSGAVAKSATIVFVNTGPGGNVFDAMAWALDPSLTNTPLPPLAPVVSISYGACESANGLTFAQEVQQIVQSGNAQGATVTAASGDSGAADCDSGNSTRATGGLAVDVPAAVPEVSAIGGTEFSADKGSPSTYWSSTTDANGGSALSYITEGIWNDTSSQGTLDSGGGGVSTFFGVPSWQNGVAGVVSGGRNVPDIALNASNGHDPYVFCSTPTGSVAACTNGFADSNNELGGVGGTSAGAPTFAGIVALLDQAIDNTGLGNVNAELYPLAASASSAFNDVTTGNNIVPCTPGTPSSDPVGLRCPSGGTMGFSAGTGYDQVSGIGSINAYDLVTNWPGFSTGASYTVGAPAITIAAAGSPGTSTITVTALNGFDGTVDLTCTPPAAATAKITCTVTPSVTVNGDTTTATLTVDTTAAHAVLADSSTKPRGMGWFAVSGGGILAGIVVMGVPSRRRKSTAMFAVVLLAFAVTGIGCGGSSSGGSSTQRTPGTPAGNYTVVVSATSGSITRTLNVSVVVQ